MDALARPTDSILPARPAWRQPLRRLLGQPTAVAPTTAAYCLAADRRVEYSVLAEPRPFVRQAPRCGDAAMLEAYASYVAAHALQPARFVATLPAAGVLDKRGYIVTADGVLLHDVSRHQGAGAPARHRLIRGWRWCGRPKCVAERLAVLTTDGAEVYCHWLLDLLPRLGQLLEAGEDLRRFDGFVVPQNRIAAGDSVLAALGVDTRRLIPVSGRVYLQADELTVPSYASARLQPSPDTVAFHRSVVLPRFAGMPGNDAGTVYPKRVYIRRNGRRRLKNPAEVEAVLARHGFATIACESLSVPEQIRLFSRAQIVVGVHGAGLANTVFCRSGTPVVELTVPQYPQFCFWDLASAAGLPLYSVFGIGTFTPGDRGDPDANVTIEPKRLEGTLIEALAAGGLT